MERVAGAAAALAEGFRVAGPQSPDRVIGAAAAAAVRQGGRMQLHRALPLTLAALVMASGCVTVHPAPVPAPEPPQPAPAADRGLPREPAAVAGPLVRLPSVPSVPSGQTAPAPDEPVFAPASAPHRPAAAAADLPARPVRAPRRAEAPRTVRTVKPAKPAPRAKARRQPAAPAKPRPVPGRSYDMGPLCEAAKGTVSPAIVALCR
ncbi:hypothetical protein B1K54_04325 [Streptomyces sp. fd1-xmd]|nr:hypothetical protein B1K54_04325 [Streptomyces sp. fd1-xmd]